MASAGPRLQTWYERLTVFRAVRTIVAIAIVLVLAGGALARIEERLARLDGAAKLDAEDTP